MLERELELLSACLRDCSCHDVFSELAVYTKDYLK